MKLFQNKETLAKAVWAIEQHTSTNHKYDEYPYGLHLNMVAEAAQEFSHLVPDTDFEDVYVACFFHDTIEDTRVTYNDVKSVAGELIANITFALTNEKGKTRKDRANSKYYEGIRSVPYARFIKICDRIANMKYAKEKGSRMLDMYKKELQGFEHELYASEYDEMFQYLRKL